MEHINHHFDVEHIRTTGLVSSKSEMMVSDSADGVACIRIANKARITCPVKMKTVTVLRTIEKAQ